MNEDDFDARQRRIFSDELGAKFVDEVWPEALEARAKYGAPSAPLDNFFFMVALKRLIQGGLEDKKVTDVGRK